MKKHSPDCISYVQERYKSLGRCRGFSRIIVDEVKEKFNEVIDSDFIKYWCVDKVAEMQEKVESAIHELDDAIEEKKLYEVEGETVIFYIKKTSPSGEEITKKYTIPFSELEAIWYDYSEHGNNLSGKKVLTIHELKRETLALLRSRLGLTKDDNAIPEVVLDFLNDNFGEEAVEAKIYEVTHKAFQDKYKRKFVKTADDVFKKEAEKAIKIAYNFQEQLELTREAIVAYEPKEILFTPKPSPDNNDTLSLFFSDFHFGNGNDSDIRKRFIEVYNYVISQPQKHVNIVSLGDLGESFAPNGMHPGMQARMSKHGYTLIMDIVSVFESFLLALIKEGKVVKFKGIGGNHDRMGENHNEDQERTIAIIIYELIKRGLQNTDIEIDYFTSKISTFTSGSLHYIIHHGDDGFSNRKPEDVLWKNGDNSKYNVILFGDKHNVNIKETKQATMIGLPALAGKGEYDTRLDLHSEPGVIVVTENDNHTADILVKRLF